MQLTCPHCQFSKEVPAAKLPNRSTRVTCPQCKESFTLPAYDSAKTELPDINCPACNLKQPQAAACSSCGLIFAKYRSAQQVTNASSSASENLADKPKAGFWLRLVAILIDSFLIFTMQVTFGVLLAMTNPNGFSLSSSMSTLLQVFSTVVSLFYWIFFTGYCGQTPGKMLLRIQVITTGGAPLSYGKAFYREVVGKFLSGIILAIGYLMAAFDDQKQALHDRMAKTYVIKL